MYKCDRCGSYFHDPKRVKNGGGDIGEDWSVCPECGSDDFSEGAFCAECGSFICSEDGRGHLCDECLAKHVDFDTALRFADGERPEEVHLNPLLAYMYTPQQIHDILVLDARASFKNKNINLQDAVINQAMIKEFVGDCRDEFEKWVVSNG